MSEPGGHDERPLRSHEMPLNLSSASRAENLLEWLYAVRDRQRSTQGRAAWVIKGKDLRWEDNRQGKMKWFMHPALDDTVIRSLMVFLQELPPGGSSGAQKTPGGAVVYILEGRGYTLLDGVRHDWRAEDVLNIPIRTTGVVVKHVNLDPDRPATFIQADVNVVDALGLDRGAEFAQIEVAPGYASREVSNDTGPIL